MKSDTERKLQEAFDDGFKSTYRAGLWEGTVAVSKVILDKANDTSKTVEERLKDIIKFCRVLLHNKESRNI